MARTAALRSRRQEALQHAASAGLQDRGDLRRPHTARDLACYYLHVMCCTYLLQHVMGSRFAAIHNTFCTRLPDLLLFATLYAPRAPRAHTPDNRDALMLKDLSNSYSERGGGAAISGHYKPAWTRCL